MGLYPYPIWRSRPTSQPGADAGDAGALARVCASDPAFALTHDNLLPLATLCVALDGLPLALELAAVRLRDLPPHVVVQQLMALRGHGHLSSTWLQQTKRNIAERHRTLQAAIDWSVRMLPPAQQDAFYYLGVFVGGCSAEAAQAVAAADPALLSGLARANLAAFDGDRVTLLETLHAFAHERLVATASWPPASSSMRCITQLLPGRCLPA